MEMWICKHATHRVIKTFGVNVMSKGEQIEGDVDQDKILRHANT